MTWLALTHSGGELQRFAIAVVAAQQADIYMIDEPSSYLDVRQRLKAAQVAVLPSPPCLVILFSHACLVILRELSATWMCVSGSAQVNQVAVLSKPAACMAQ